MSTTPGSRFAAAVARLRASGERVTPARQAVLDVIDAADRQDEHLTADEIETRVATHAPKVHRATVYRTLSSLSQAGILDHIHVAGSATVYHLASDLHSEVAAHSHVQCTTCGRVIDVDPRALAGVAEHLHTTLGFRLDIGHTALLGTCADCDRTVTTGGQ